MRTSSVPLQRRKKTICKKAKGTSWLKLITWIKKITWYRNLKSQYVIYEYLSLKKILRLEYLYILISRSGRKARCSRRRYLFAFSS